jgi:hypothetical protein
MLSFKLPVISHTQTFQPKGQVRQDYVSSKRHRLAHGSVTHGMTVAFYSKNKLIKEGMLQEWKQEIKENNQTKQKGKRKIIVLDDEA